MKCKLKQCQFVQSIGIPWEGFGGLPGHVSVPGHTGKSAIVAGRHVIRLNLGREFYTLFGQNAAVGSRKYQAWDKE